ncbi:hypothetical protein AX16_010028 [Volvariella volvacea WC 439]|nr:hypothetical protein AX16_010028 [Volvariella volvacea WC 439]
MSTKTTTQNSLFQIRQLLNIMNNAVDDLEATCVRNGTPLPDIDEPFTRKSEAFRSDPSAAEAATLIGAAAEQLDAIVTPPHHSIYNASCAAMKSMALRICLESNVTEILREAGGKGLHVKEICKQNGQDPPTLARFLRMLATHFIYREVEPNVFANTRMSSLLDSGKSTKEIAAAPDHKYDEAGAGLAALASFQGDELFKAASYGWECIAEPANRARDPDTYNPWTAATKTKNMWEYFSRPGRDASRRKFNAAMIGTSNMQPYDVPMQGFDWAGLRKGSVVVDVGGNLGGVSRWLAERFPNLNIVVQDLPHVIEDAKKLWQERIPDAIQSGRVKLEAHDFFTKQPHKDADIFLMKHIVHDWSDNYARVILRNLRDSAQPHTRLILLEGLIPYACHDNTKSRDGTEIPGSKMAEAPAPLLANYGGQMDYIYYLDMAMYTVCNSQERTVPQYEELLASAGWKLNKIAQHPGAWFHRLEAIPMQMP